MKGIHKLKIVPYSEAEERLRYFIEATNNEDRVAFKTIFKIGYIYHEYSFGQKVFEDIRNFIILGELFKGEA